MLCTTAYVIEHIHHSDQCTCLQTICARKQWENNTGKLQSDAQLQIDAPVHEDEMRLMHLCMEEEYAPVEGHLLLQLEMAADCLGAGASPGSRVPASWEHIEEIPHQSLVPPGANCCWLFCCKS
jgi:hypothetical protein